jgi:hypothetical protein
MSYVVTPLGLVQLKPRVRSILTTHELVRKVMFAHDRAEIDQAMAIVARCLADCRNHGASDLVVHWEEILQQQYRLWQHWSTPQPIPGTPKKRGRRKGHRDIPDDELFERMYEGRRRWFERHPQAKTMTQPQLLEAMNIYAHDASRVRRWCRQLEITWEFFSQR